MDTGQKKGTLSDKPPRSKTPLPPPPPAIAGPTRLRRTELEPWATAVVPRDPLTTPNLREDFPLAGYRAARQPVGSDDRDGIRGIWQPAPNDRGSASSSPTLIAVVPFTETRR